VPKRAVVIKDYELLCVLCVCVSVCSWLV